MYQKRLENLRSQFRQQGISALWITPHNRFLKTETKPDETPITWLSGFKGSSGSILVTDRKAILRTDSRYVTHARDNLDNNFLVVDSCEVALKHLFLDYLDPATPLGFDPWSISVDTFEALKVAAPERPLVPLKERLSKLLPDLPKQTRAQKPPFILDTKRSIQAILKPIQDTLDERETFFCGDCNALSWILGLRSFSVPFTPYVEGYGLLTKRSLFFWCHPDAISSETQRYLGSSVSLLNLSDFETSFIAITKGLKILFEKKTTPLKVQLLASEANRPTDAVRNPIQPLQIVKTPKDLDALSVAHLKEGLAFTYLFYAIEKALASGDTLTELAVSERLESIRKNDPSYRGPSFETIAAFAANTAFMHYHPTADTTASLSANHLFLLDAGGQYMPGATTDTTRTIFLGEKPTANHKRFYTAVLKGLIAYTTATFSKETRGIHLDALARQFLWQEGADFKHATGHGVGNFLSVHEPPTLSAYDDGVLLKPGMTLTCEPGYYLENAFGIRLENMMTVIKSPHDGFYTFKTETRVPFDQKLIDVEALSKKEIAFVDTYHQEVFHTLYPLLHKEDMQEWLRHQTRPLETST